MYLFNFQFLLHNLNLRTLQKRFKINALIKRIKFKMINYPYKNPKVLKQYIVKARLQKIQPNFQLNLNF